MGAPIGLNNWKIGKLKGKFEKIGKNWKTEGFPIVFIKSMVLLK